MSVDAAPPRPVNRIALIRPSALGDVCRTVPVLASLRRAFPDAEIDWIVQDTFADAVRAHPDLTRVIPFARRRFSRVCRSWPVTREWLSWVNDLRRRRYDVVFDFQGLARSGLIAFLTRSPRRVGFADAREGGALGYTVRHAVAAERHTVDRMLALVEAEGVPAVHDMRLYTPADAQAWWAERCAELSLRPGAYVVFAPTSRWESKRWPAERFASLAQRLLAGRAETIILVGGGEERGQVGSLLDLAARDRHVVDLIGATSVGGLMAVIERATLLVANDSAALHMAVGLGRPYVALFGPTDASLVGPYGGREWVIQPPVDPTRLNHKDTSLGSSIMEQISVEQVAAMIERRRAAAPDAAAPGPAVIR